MRSTIARHTLVAALATAMVLAAAPPASARAHIQISAADTVGTAIEFSKQRFAAGTGSSAILGRSDGFADSLAAGALAGYVSAPLLVNPPGPDLDDRVAAELDRLGATIVRIVGGTAAVSAEVESELEGLGYTVARYAGPDRITTAVAVAEDVVDAEGASIYAGEPDVYLARAFGDGSAAFADSLGGGMVAGTFGGPLLLTETASLSTATHAYLDGRDDVETVWIVGGTAAVSTSVEEHIEAMGIDVMRIAGANRFATAADAAMQSFNIDNPSATVALVDGLHADSWVSGFAASAFSGGAIALSNGTSIPSETAQLLSEINEQRDDLTLLLCAPQVPAAACTEADDLLNA